jgi:hypothetical protein
MNQCPVHEPDDPACGETELCPNPLPEFANEPPKPTVVSIPVTCHATINADGTMRLDLWADAAHAGWFGGTEGNETGARIIEESGDDERDAAVLRMLGEEVWPVAWDSLPDSIQWHG